MESLLHAEGNHLDVVQRMESLGREWDIGEPAVEVLDTSGSGSVTRGDRAPSSAPTMRRAVSTIRRVL
jgi:hypothetical protein